MRRRHQVAVEAARLLYHREFKEYYQAKREAARRLGTKELPTNREIHRQIMALADRIEGSGRLDRLDGMRQLAVELMELLKDFHPRLIGSTLKGHIRKGSDVDLHLFTEDLDSVIQVLESAGLVPTVEVVRSQKSPTGEPTDYIHVKLDHPNGIPVEMTVYPPEWLQIRPKCSITGGPIERAGLAEARQLLREETLPDWLQRELTLETVLPKLPELSRCRGVLQNHYHHLDVFEHTLEVFRGLADLDLDLRLRTHLQRPGPNGLSRPKLLQLLALFHDLGKPDCWSQQRDGRIRFHGHEHTGAALARSISGRWRLPSELARTLETLVSLHMEPMHLAMGRHPDSRHYRLFQGAGDYLPELLLHSLADLKAARGPARRDLDHEVHRAWVAEMLEEFFSGGFLATAVVPVSAQDLESELGIKPGRLRRNLREELQDAYIDGEFDSREDGLNLAAELLSTYR